MAVVKSWTLPPTAFAKLTEKQHTQIMKKLTFEVGRRLIMKTPVDTGRARGGWMPSIGSPAGGEGGPDPEGVQTLARVRVTMSEIDSRGGQVTIYFTNNVSYIGYLNAGTSKQAPAHFVEATVDEVTSVIQ